MLNFKKFFIFLLNYFIFKINICFLWKKINIINALNFKNVDKFQILFSRESLNNISNHLNLKLFF